MDEQILLRLLAGGFGSGMDMTALIAFIAFAAVYVIAPTIGYTSERPAGLIASLYILIGYGGLSLFQLFVQWLQVLDHAGVGAFPAPARHGEFSLHFFFIFAALKMTLFLVAMVAFATGLRSLRLRRTESPAHQVSEDKVQQLREENARLRRKLEQRGGRGEEGTQEVRDA